MTKLAEANLHQLFVNTKRSLITTKSDCPCPNLMCPFKKTQFQYFVAFETLSIQSKRYSCRHALHVVVIHTEPCPVMLSPIYFECLNNCRSQLMIGTGFRFIFSILLLPGADATLVSLSIVDAFVGGGGIMIRHATLLQKVCRWQK